MSELLGNGITVDEYLEAIGCVFDEEEPEREAHKHAKSITGDGEDDQDA